MAVKVLLSRDFDHTHERILFDEFCKKLYAAFHDKDEQYLVIGNLHVEGKELDAILVKKDAISVIEFKNYGGSLNFFENGEWPITQVTNGVSETVSVRGGTKDNPYQQVRQNKFGLFNMLKSHTSYSNEILGHISGIVLFSQNVDFDPFSITPKIASWFHVTDLSNITGKINQITSNKIRLSKEEILGFKKIFNLGFADEVEVPEEYQIAAVNETSRFEEPLIYDIPYNIISSEAGSVEEIINATGYNIIYRETLPERKKEIVGIEDLNLSPGCKKFLKEDVKSEIYKHQYKALNLLKEGANVAISTSTSSGKSLVFYAHAIELISKNPNAKIIAIYPLKALGYQQEEKWLEAFEKSGMNISIGRIDGSVPTSERIRLINNSNVICVTPDVIHSWFLSKLDNKSIKSFFRNLALVIIDEVHVYRGVFGSNAAYLFRRINYVNEQLRLAESKAPQYLCASATINHPEGFLEKLIGLNFEIIDTQYETSPKHPIEVYLLDVQEDSEPYSRIADFLNRLSVGEENRSITFVDNRKAVEQIASISDRLENNQIFPYRSGYESEDRIKIQNNLQNGVLKGVISTSALEMGIDIGHLNIGVLFGVPSSQTSFMQRIGRIGRHQPGKVFIINDRSIRSERIFQNPQNIFNIPPADTALYLDNEYIQYIHALCLVGLQGNSESDAVANKQLEVSSVIFPKNFLQLCDKVKNSIEPQYLKNLNSNSNELPHHAFPLRDIEKQFKIELHEGKDITPLGDMTKSQQMREAYPGAVYYHMKRPYRVRSIEGNKVRLRNEANYSTRPSLQIMPYPNIQDGLIQGKAFGNTAFIECNLDVYENIFGYSERRGGRDEVHHNYPNNYYTRRTYSRRIVTTGVVIGRGALSRINSTEKIEAIANIFFNVFLTNIPFEPSDLNYCIGAFNQLNNGGLFDNGERYICIFDKTYGSLRLTSRLMFQEVLIASINSALDWLDSAEYVYTKDGELLFIEEEIVQFFHSLKEEILLGESDLQTIRQVDAPPQNDFVSVLALGQKIKMIDDDQEFSIDWVYPQEENGVNSILYDLKNSQNEMVFGVLQTALAVTPDHETKQYDLIRKRIL